MPLVATLISNPADAAIDPALANSAAAAIGASGPDWLAERVACDLFLSEGADRLGAETSLRSLIGPQPIDVIVQKRHNRRKKFLLADMDSTMIEQECIDELADEVGLKAEVAAITERAMNGQIAFEPALRERVALLEGLPLNVIDEILTQRITLASGARELVHTMRREGAWTTLVSGGFTSFTGPLAQRIGFHEHIANELEVADGRLTGTVREPILGRQAKADTLLRLANRLRLSPAEAIAVGDGANDLDMICLAGTGIALHAKPIVSARAPYRIDHGDLTALLYIQGYRQLDFCPLN